jgi:hypothetical protein
MGVWASLDLACRLSISDMIFLGDSKIVIDGLKRKADLQVVALERWKERINESIFLFRNLSFDHIYREDNMEADNLSKKALIKIPSRISFSQWEDGIEPPPPLFLKL